MRDIKDYVLVAENTSKHFGGIKALNEVSFYLKAGEIHALMGENGAGKSTLGKLFAGIHKPDGGKIYFGGKGVRFENPKAAKNAGISIVLQELNLLPDLTVAENLVIGNDAFYQNGFILKKKQMYKHANELLRLFNLENSIDVYERVERLSVAQMQVLEILKAVDTEAKVIILDEPTATLSPVEAERLFSIVRQLREEKNIGFIIVSHKIDEIFEIADRVTVLRDGCLVLEGAEISSMTEQSLVKSMVGREINDLYGTREFEKGARGEVVLKAENVCDFNGRVKNISLELRKGEILGLTGIIGAGRTEFARCIFGIDKIKTGKVYVHGKELVPHTIKNAISLGVALVPEDRKNEGLLLNESIVENVSLVTQGVQKSLILSKRKSRSYMEKVKKDLAIKMSDENNVCSSLSGGNQQKVLLGKWLVMDPDILIIDEPTRGIDISAKAEIYSILNGLSEKGISILMISSEMPEIIGMCDRAIVFREGEIAGELERDELTEHNIAFLSTTNTSNISRQSERRGVTQQ